MKDPLDLVIWAVSIGCAWMMLTSMTGLDDVLKKLVGRKSSEAVLVAKLDLLEKRVAELGDKRSMPRRDFGSPSKNAGLCGPLQIQIPDAAALLAKGYAVASVNYRLGNPKVSASSMADGAFSASRDGKAAVRYLRANCEKYGIRKGKLECSIWSH